MPDDPVLTEDQRMIREAVRDLACAEIAPRAEGIDREGSFPREGWGKLAELGLPGFAVPEGAGGVGGDVVGCVLAVEEVARACASTATLLALHGLAVAGPVAACGSDGARASVLPGLVTGERIGTLALSEPGSGADTARFRTVATRDGEGWCLKGEKGFVAAGAEAGTFLTAARIDGSCGVGWFLVERDRDGVEVGSSVEILGLRGTSWTPVRFEGCVLGADAHVDGDGVADHIRTGIGLAFAAVAVGIAQNALDRARPYARERKAFGRPIAEFDAVGDMLVAMETETAAARALLHEAARRVDAGESGGEGAVAARAEGCAAAIRCADRAVQILGGYGYMAEYVVERLYRDAIAAATVLSGT